MALNQQLLCRQIDKKATQFQNEPLNMFFHRFSYKELASDLVGTFSF